MICGGTKRKDEEEKISWISKIIQVGCQLFRTRPPPLQGKLWVLFSLPSCKGGCILKAPYETPGSVREGWSWEGSAKSGRRSKENSSGNACCWAQPDFPHKTDRSAEMVGTFLFLPWFFFFFTLPFLSLHPSSFFLQPDKVFAFSC